MKVKKEDLLKIIAILNRLVLIEEDVIDITEAFKVKSSVIKKYNIPDNFYLKATNDREKEIVRKWVENNNSLYLNSDWINNADSYFLSIVNGKYNTGHRRESLMPSGAIKISFEEFEYFINNTKVKHDKFFVLYSSRDEFDELNRNLCGGRLGYLNSKLENGMSVDDEQVVGWVFDKSDAKILEDKGYVQITFEDWKKNYN